MSSPTRPRCFRSKLLEADDGTHAAQQSKDQRLVETVPVTWEFSADERKSCTATRLTWRACGEISDNHETCKARGCCWLAKPYSGPMSCYLPAWGSSLRTTTREPESAANTAASTEHAQARVSTSSGGTAGATAANTRTGAEDGTSSEQAAFASLVAEVRDVWRSVSSGTMTGDGKANHGIDVAGGENESEPKHASRSTLVLIVLTSLAALMVLSTVCMSCFFRSDPAEHESGDELTPRFDFRCCTVVSRQDMNPHDLPIREESSRQNLYMEGIPYTREGSSVSMLEESICSLSPRSTKSMRGDVRSCSVARREQSSTRSGCMALQVVEEPKKYDVLAQATKAEARLLPAAQRTRCTRMQNYHERHKEVCEMFEMRWDTTLWLAADGIAVRPPLVREVWDLEANEQHAAYTAKASQLDKLPGHKHGYTKGNEKHRFHGARIKCKFNGLPCGDPTCDVCRVIQLGHFSSSGKSGELVFTSWSHTAKGYGLAPGKEPPPANLNDFVAPGAGNAVFVASVLLGTPEVVKWKTTGPLPPGRQSRVADKSASVDELVIFDPDQALPQALLLFA